MDPRKRRILLLLLLACLVSFIAALLNLFPRYLTVEFPSLLSRSKWLSTSGLLFDIAGIVQLEISGLFDKIFEEYNDVYKYPGGPPSNITRPIIDDPDRPFRTGLRNWLFFEHRSGFYLIALGCGLQLTGVWAWGNSW
jgi:hypothetical protein